MTLSFVVTEGTECTWEQHCGHLSESLFTFKSRTFSPRELRLDQSTDSCLCFDLGPGGFVHILKSDLEVYDHHGSAVEYLYCPECGKEVLKQKHNMGSPWACRPCWACGDKGYLTEKDFAVYKKTKKEAGALLDQANFNLLE